MAATKEGTRKRRRPKSVKYRGAETGKPANAATAPKQPRPAMWGEGDGLGHSYAVFKEYGKKYGRLDQEHVVCLVLNTKNKVIAEAVTSLGGTSKAHVELVQIFKHVIRAGAERFIVIHNHPSGDPEPTPDDYSVTKRIAEGARLLGLTFLDHLVVGDGYRSMADDDRLS